MIQFLKEWVMNIVTLAIFIVLLEILIPSGKTKKFVNLVSGFILIIALINPVLGFLGKKVDLKEFQIPSSNFLDKSEIEQNSKILEEKQLKQIVELYRKKIIKQLEDRAKNVEGVSGVKADVLINEDYKSENFCEIKRIYIYLSPEENPSDIKPVTKVEKVDISGEKPGKKENHEAEEKLDNGLKEKVENEIDKLFQVGRENIVVSFDQD